MASGLGRNLQLPHLWCSRMSRLDNVENQIDGKVVTFNGRFYFIWGLFPFLCAWQCNGVNLDFLDVRLDEAFNDHDRNFQTWMERYGHWSVHLRNRELASRSLFHNAAEVEHDLQFVGERSITMFQLTGDTKNTRDLKASQILTNFTQNHRLKFLYLPTCLPSNECYLALPSINHLFQYMGLLRGKGDPGAFFNLSYVSYCGCKLHARGWWQMSFLVVRKGYSHFLSWSVPFHLFNLLRLFMDWMSRCV